MIRENIFLAAIPIQHTGIESELKKWIGDQSVLLVLTDCDSLLF